MSKSNSAVKVLRVALKRIQNRWNKGSWVHRASDGQYKVCLEGAIFGFCQDAQTPAQREAYSLVCDVIQDRYPNYKAGSDHLFIPNWNDDPKRTVEEVEEVIKLAIIRAETGYDPAEDFIDPDEVDSLI